MSNKETVQYYPANVYEYRLGCKEMVRQVLLDQRENSTNLLFVVGKYATGRTTSVEKPLMKLKEK